MSRKSITTEQFIIDAYCKHGDKYNYKLVNYKNRKSKVKIICPEHGTFEQISGAHKRGNGCPECAKIYRNNKKRKTTKQFIIDAYCKHGDRYNYSLVDYKHSHTKIKIICPEHGVFEQSPNSHLNGSGCNKCFIDGLLKNTEWFIDRACSIHDDRYVYKLSYYTKKKDKIKIICPEHGVFEQRVENHLYGQGCPECATNIISSKQEIELQEWLSGHIDIKCNDRSIIKPFELDIIIPEKKLAIEYNGLYWHSEQQGKDYKYHLNKYNQCKEVGYRLIQVWENEWLSKKDIVKSIILNAIGKHTNKVHGRKCDIKVVKPKEARIMYDNNHIQGFKGGEHHGLYYNGQLVSLMTIDKRGELQRFVNKKSTIVHGAFSKLLKSFDYKEIYTFADLRYFTGNVYEKNGFEYMYTTKPNYYYFKKMGVYHRRMFQRKNIERMANKGLMLFDNNLTEYQNMLVNGYDRIWDCGNKKYTLY